MDDPWHLKPGDDKCCVESAVKCLTRPYVGRLAPTPSGYLHIGHAQTFWTAQQRSRRTEEGTGSLILRIEDLDGPRCKPHYLTDMLYDLSWFGFMWTHGPHLAVATDVDSSGGNNRINADCEVRVTDDDDRMPKKSKMDDNGEKGAANVANNSNSSLLDLVPFMSVSSSSN